MGTQRKNLRGTPQAVKSRKKSPGPNTEGGEGNGPGGAGTELAEPPLYRPSDSKREIDLVPPDGDPEPYRTPWRRDYARVIHSPAFRRLQGKTQLFPGVESDFFRNRLTHSLEVAQIAKSIAIRINNTEEFFKRPDHGIDTDLVEVAGLVHDIGHPPFGHNGEKALDECMRSCGGFEGNAQTLRILTKLEKRQKHSGSSASGIATGEDRRVGLNLCYRTLAAALKYDRQIPYTRPKSNGLAKGYYRSEADLVRRIKEAVTGLPNFTGEFKTIECQIMDLADDIAYSTYDLEDSFKAKFLSPLSMLGANPDLADEICSRVSKTLGRPYNRADMISCLSIIFKDLFDVSDYRRTSDNMTEEFGMVIAFFSKAADGLMSAGYRRASFTSHLVGKFISGVQVQINQNIPALSKVSLRADILEQVEVLKHFTFCSLIMSPRLKVAEYRGKEIVTELFTVLSDEDGEGYRLLPDDVQAVYAEIESDQKARVVCDFIAGMTDRYAIEFYGRLKSENPETIFKPH